MELIIEEYENFTVKYVKGSLWDMYIHNNYNLTVV